MVKDPIRAHEHAVGEAAVQERTGRAREEWFALLDDAGARSWDHASTARWLGEQGVPPWWCQSLTVGYEQARGLRAPGQRPDGTFETSSSRTLAAPLADVEPWVVDDARRAQWLEVPVTLRGVTPGRRVRWDWPEGGRVTVHVDALPDGRTRVSVQHQALADGTSLAALKAAWSARLDRLRTVLGE